MALWWGVNQWIPVRDPGAALQRQIHPTNNHSRGTCQNALKSAAKGIFTSEEC